MAIYTPLINKNNKSQFGMFKAAVPTDTDLVIASGATGFQSLGGGSSGPGGNDGIAQEFTTTSTGLYAITVDIAKVGSPTDNLVMKIVSSINSSTIIATSNEIVGSSLTTTRTARTFFFPSNVTLLSNTDYFFRITRTGASNASNYYTISSDSGNPYSGNTAYELETIWLTLTGVDIKCTIHTAFNYGVGTNAIQLPSDIKSLWATYKENPSISALNSNYTPSFGTTLIEKVAQSFTNISGALASVILWLNCSNVIDQTQVRLCSDSSGSPGSTIATSNAQTITSGSYSPYTFVFSASPTLSSGTIYWLVLERTGSINNTDNYSMYGSTVSIYSDGSVKIYTSSSWVTDTMVDFRFIMYTEPGIVHITTQETSGRVSYHQFNTSTDTWSIVSELVTNATAPASADCAVSHSVRSDGSVVCAYQSGTSAVYKIRSSGGTWGANPQ